MSHESALNHVKRTLKSLAIDFRSFEKIDVESEIKTLIWVNFTNILGTAFSYESFARSFFVLAVSVKLFIGARILAQMHLLNVGEIESFS